MAEVTISLGQSQRGELPPVCIRCGSDAQGVLSERLSPFRPIAREVRSVVNRLRNAKKSYRTNGENNPAEKEAEQAKKTLEALRYSIVFCPPGIAICALIPYCGFHGKLQKNRWRPRIWLGWAAFLFMLLAIADLTFGMSGLVENRNVQVMMALLGAFTSMVGLVLCIAILCLRRDEIVVTKAEAGVDDWNVTLAGVATGFTEAVESESGLKCEQEQGED